MVEWSKDLYTNPHVSKSLTANGMMESASQSDLNASMVDLNLNNEEDDPSQYEKVTHCLGMSYYVNFLEGLSSNEFHTIIEPVLELLAKQSIQPTDYGCPERK